MPKVVEINCSLPMDHPDHCTYRDMTPEEEKQQEIDRAAWIANEEAEKNDISVAEKQRQSDLDVLNKIDPNLGAIVKRLIGK